MGNHNQKISTAPKLRTVERIKDSNSKLSPLQVFLEPPHMLDSLLSIEVNKHFYKSLDIHTTKPIISRTENTCYKRMLMTLFLQVCQSLQFWFPSKTNGLLPHTKELNNHLSFCGTCWIFTCELSCCSTFSVWWECLCTSEPSNWDDCELVCVVRVCCNCIWANCEGGCCRGGNGCCMKGSCFSIWETDWGNELVEFGRRGYEALGIHPPIELPRLGASLPKKEYILYFLLLLLVSYTPIGFWTHTIPFTLS